MKKFMASLFLPMSMKPLFLVAFKAETYESELGKLKSLNFSLLVGMQRSKVKQIPYNIIYANEENRGELFDFLKKEGDEEKLFDWVELYSAN